MLNLVAKLEKPSRELEKVHKEYLYSRNILNRYSSEELACWGSVDLYLLLDLDMYRTEPIPQHILEYVVKNKMYEYHPDVNKGRREAFLLVRIARDVFGDNKLRLFYDSGFLDESIPEDRIYYEEEFFRVFGECFERNSKFSIKQPVPKLDAMSSLEDTKKFYEFWSSFRSWRRFESAEELYKMSDYERSQYSINNKEKLNQLKNQDALRIKRLVQIARKRDPRIGKSIEEQVSEIMNAKWSPLEVSTLKKLIMLLGKTKKNKWEIITAKLVELTKIKRTVSEVMKKGAEIEKK